MEFKGIDEAYCAAIRDKLDKPCVDHGYHIDRDDYASVNRPGTSSKMRLHRKVYCEANNVTIESIEGLVVMHLCDNKRCIEPTHLQLGTHKENSQDAVKKGRMRNYRVRRDPSKYLYEEFNNVDVNDYVK